MIAEACSLGGRGNTNDDGDKKQEQEEEVMSMSIDSTYSPGGEAARMTMVMNADEMVFSAHRYVEAQHP